MQVHIKDRLLPRLGMDDVGVPNFLEHGSRLRLRRFAVHIFPPLADLTPEMTKTNPTQ
jgi:hypothetical protein